MAAADYIDLADYKVDHGISDTSTDATLTRLITRASRAVDRFCFREPGGFAAQTLTKYLDVTRSSDGRARAALVVPPLLSVTTLKTDEDGDGVFEVTWTALTDYILYPLNNTPKLEIRVNASAGRYTFPLGQRRVEIVGSWGEATTVPEPIAEAVDLQVSRWRWRMRAPEGVAGNEAGIVELKDLDPDVQSILVRAHYRSAPVFA